MKIIICGATGFIGRNLVEYFSSEEHEIIAIFNKKEPINKLLKNVTWVKADLRIPNILKDYLSNTDLFLQFAATTSGAKDITQRPYIHVTDNAVMNSYLSKRVF